MSKQTTSGKWLKSINQQTVLRLIYAEGPVSRVKLAEKTGLTQQTITNIVNRLLEDNLVQEQVPVENGVGRKPVPLVVNSGSLYAIGIEVAVRYVRGALVDFQNRLIAEATETLYAVQNEGKTVQRIDAVVNDLLGRVPQMGQLKGIGCSIQGLVDSARGVVIHSPGLGWSDVPLKQCLEERYKLPVYLENDANLLAVVENLNGVLASSAHNVTIKLDHGIGGAHVVNKQLNSGSSHVAGEMGHYKAFFGEAARTCHCGGKGCLTTLVSGSGMKRNLGYSLDDFSGFVQEGNPLAQDWFSTVEEPFGIAVSNVITFLNPDHVLFTGRLYDALGDAMKARIMQRIRENIPETCGGVRLVELEQTPNESVLAAGLVMNRFFDVPVVPNRTT